MKTVESKPIVTIITPSYNQGKFIEKTILSVVCQDYQNIQYVVVDGGSQDETREILSYYQKHINILIVEADKGQADAINKGLKLAKGEVIAYINSDDCYASKTVVSEVVDLFNCNPDVDLFYGQRNDIDENGYFQFSHPYRPFSRKNLFLTCYLPQESSFWRRSILEKSGFYVDDSFQFALDYELWLRLLNHDAKFLSVNSFYGLFRSYAHQKSIAQWKNVGLSEINRINQIYLDRVISEKEMLDRRSDHYFLANPSDCQQAMQFAHPFWSSFVSLKKEGLKLTPLDNWGIHQYLIKFGMAPYAKLRGCTVR